MNHLGSAAGRHPPHCPTPRQGVERGERKDMQRKQYALVERIYGSVGAARDAWAQEALRTKAREAARIYTRTGKVPGERLFGSHRAPRQDQRS
jgi:hypothetical protein